MYITAKIINLSAFLMNNRQFKWLIVLPFVILFTQPVQSQTKVLIDDIMFSIDARAAIDSLYNRNTSGAREIMQPWRDDHPEHPLWHLWDGMEIWWEILVDLDDISMDEDFINKMREADYEASRLLRRQPDHTDALIIRAVANSYVARMHANREEWVTSMTIGRRGYQAHQRLVEVAPNLPDNLFAEGMKLYYSAYIPEAYPVVRAVSWFLPDGDREGGLKTLEDASNRAVFARPEAAYFLATILLNYEEDYDKAKIFFRRLVDQYPNNGYYRRQFMRTMAQLDEYSTMKSFYAETMQHWERNDLPQDPVMDFELAYWHGRAQYHTGQLHRALSSFSEAVEIGGTLINYENRDLYTLAAYFAGTTSERLQQRDSAKKYYEIAANQRAAPNARRQARDRLSAM